MVTCLAPYHEATGALIGHPSRLSRWFRPRNFLQISYLITHAAAQLRKATTYWTTPIPHLSQEWNLRTCHLPFLSLLEALASSESVNDLLGIIRSPEFDLRLFSTHVIDVRRCCDITDRIVRKHKHSWPKSILPRMYHHVFTFSGVFFIRNIQ